MTFPATPAAPQRHPLMTARVDVQRIAAMIHTHLAANQPTKVREVVATLHPADLADAMIFLDAADDVALYRLLGPEEAAEVLDEVDTTTRSVLLQATPPDLLPPILSRLPADEGAAIVRALPATVVEQVLQATPPDLAQAIRSLLVYAPSTAGALMSLDYLAVLITLTQAGAVAQLQKQAAAPSPYVFAVDAQGNFRGLLSLHSLLIAPAATPLTDLLLPTELTVPPSMDQQQVTAIFARYDVLALPVISAEPHGRLLGVITPDDVIDVLQAAQNQEVAHLAGSDAQELEQKSPVQVAKLRLPWIMSTLFIELLAGFVIRIFNGTLQQYILLASFMPIISAISGNTGLQSAAIIIRGLSSGLIQLGHWRQALARQVATTAILGAACGVVLGVIGAIWAHNWVFGLVILLGMFFAVNIAGIVGTIVPLLSKRAGFDPALTAGPFETAFQDVVGISIFLGLATALLRFLR